MNDTITDPAVLDPSHTWRSVPADQSFTCTACGTTTMYGGGMQTVDGAQQLCTRCDSARIAAHWWDRPAGTSAVRLTGADGTSTIGGVYTHKPYPYPANVSPAVQWGLIVSAGTRADTPGRARITARVAAAIPASYGLPTDATADDVTAAHDALYRGPFGRQYPADRADAVARRMLAAYAAQITGAIDVEPVERRALAFDTH